MENVRDECKNSDVYLIGETKEHFCGRKLPSKKEVLQVFFHHHILCSSKLKMKVQNVLF